jgi:hypothetical protein
MQVLASDINTGYQDIGNVQVLKVNGEEVKNLAHMAHLIESCTKPFVCLDLEWSKVGALLLLFGPHSMYLSSYGVGYCLLMVWVDIMIHKTSSSMPMQHGM